MKMKISKKFLILITSLSLLIVSVVVLACADYDYSDFYQSFFAPETSHTPESAPFYRSRNAYYGNTEYLGTMHEMDSTNIAEWRSFFNGKVAINDLKYLVYQSRIGEIDTCIFFIKNNQHPITEQLKANSLLAFDNPPLAKDFLFYLGFAKRCEPFVTYERGWWNEDEVDPCDDKAAMKKLVVGGEKAMIASKLPFIKERYAFQLVRIFYHSGAYNECIDFYDRNKNLFSSKNSIPFRALGYVAASHYKLKEYSNANYLYAVLFDQCEEMKRTCVRSFHPQEEADWSGALDLAQNAHEKEVLWHLLGLYVDPLRAMTEIYKLNAKSNMLDLLLVREVNINEESFIGVNEIWDFEPDTTYALNTQKVNTKLLYFSKLVADNGNSNKPYLWNLTTGYLYLAKGNYSEAETYLSKAQSGAADDVLVNEQIHAFRIMSKIEQYAKPALKTEAELTKELIWLSKEKRHPSLRSSSIYEWALGRLSEKYRNWGDSVKAQCLDYRQNMQFYENEVNINGLISLMDKPSKTEFEKFILAVHPYDEAELYTYKAIKQIYQYKFEEALGLLNAYPEAGNGYLNADPFMIRINDCHDCDAIDSTKEEYNHSSFIKRLIELQTKAETNSENAAQYYFLLANGLYNMTYFGNSRIVYYSPITEYSVGQIYYDFSSSSSKKQLFDCSEAMKYYQKAMDASTDSDFKAKCCFMAAKCEQNQYFSSEKFNWQAPVRSGIYFKQLRDTYSETNYYQEVISECGYFRTYLDKKK